MGMMLQRDVDLLQWCIEADGLDSSELRELGDPGDEERMQKLVRLGFVEHTLDGWYVPTPRGAAAVACN